MKVSTLIFTYYYFCLYRVHAAVIDTLPTEAVSNAPSSTSTLPPNANSIPTSSASLIFSASAGSASFSASATSSSQSAQPSSPLLASGVDQDVATLLERRLSNIVGDLTNAASIGTWLSTQNANGQWPDVDYTTGCTAQRANWPAKTHLDRLSTLAGAWHGALAGATQYAQDPSVLVAAKSAMDYWFANDMTNVACLDQGGSDACPCGSPGLWNTNWYPGIIGIPMVVSVSCLLLNSTLTEAEKSKCVDITARAYQAFVVPAHGVGTLTGANLLDVAKIGVDLGLLTTNVSLIQDAYSRVHNELVIKLPTRADGIRPDGSFSQHNGILYNGNYGKDYTNDVVGLEVGAGGTSFQATPASQTAMETLFNGHKWMIYRNVVTGILHWDFSALGRFIAFPATDVTQATASILLNLTKIGELGESWGSEPITEFSSSLLQGSSSANAGDLIGNKMFFDNDYMVHRSSNYVTSVKMVSSRGVNTECTNSANPFGFHLSTGALRTYLRGDEYESIAAAMDWNLIPGITTDYGATPLNCGQTGSTGVEAFVGGVSDGQIGVAAMRYTNPLTKALKFQKAYFFLDNDVQLVMISNITSTTTASVISVLDQKRRNGDVIVNSDTRVPTSQTPFSQAGGNTQTLWHDNVGYNFAASPASAFSLSVQLGEKTGSWNTIGTSPAPPVTVDLFSAWLVHSALNVSLAYTIYPGVDFSTFTSKVKQNTPRVIQNDGSISAAVDPGSFSAMAVFWTAGGGKVNFAPGSPAAFTIAASGTAAVIFSLKTGVVTVSDPTQTLGTVSVTLAIGAEHLPAGSASIAKTLTFTLPDSSRGLAGSSVSQNIF
ncbi:Polysaccharide lyase family 8 protein [Mycena indigotica]|uniref:Polysaccharide lyase family 8 protein n=1 Tax=Mycena indigotica TaxID=2126181 RepID=A0A8H6SXF4_9AGAR|nr:Polysaccharide lyase family 8 protein [Mycena indigotica]KAF7307058.1 Polysaccharide lyase family 8 protein [Mycena indigotica]